MFLPSTALIQELCHDLLHVDTQRKNVCDEKQFHKIGDLGSSRVIGWGAVLPVNEPYHSWHQGCAYPALAWSSLHTLLVPLTYLKVHRARQDWRLHPPTSPRTRIISGTTSLLLLHPYTSSLLSFSLYNHPRRIPHHHVFYTQSCRCILFSFGNRYKFSNNGGNGQWESSPSGQRRLSQRCARWRHQ